MGWTFLHRGSESDLEFYRHELGDGVLAVKTVDSVAYIAYKMENGFVIGCIVLTERQNDYYNFGYKDMDESMGPYECKCPQEIFDMLSPLEQLFPEGHEWAARWRRDVKEYLAKQKSIDERKTNGVDVKILPDPSFEWISEYNDFIEKCKQIGFHRMDRVSSNDHIRKFENIDLTIYDSQIANAKQLRDSLARSMRKSGWIVFVKSYPVLGAYELEATRPRVVPLFQIV